MSAPVSGLGLRLLRRPLTSSSFSSSPSCSAYNTAFKPITRPSTILRLTRSYASKPSKRTLPKSKPAPTAPPPARYFSIEENLARTGQETVLYQSGSRLLIYLYYGLSAASITWAGSEFYENVICQPDAPQWTKAVSALGAGMGLVICAYTFWVPSRMVHRIIAIPRAGAVPPSVNLQVQARSIIPFKRRLINATPKSTYFVSPFYKAETDANRWEFKGYLGPIKYIGWLAVAGFKTLLRTLRMEDFAKIKVGESGVIYRIDRHGWAWEKERKGLDMLLKAEAKSYPFKR
ncbi:hypothetical protein H072_7539 [Dactylellina haptotyla CBS 200.50]|uniref:Uncharacterized protein n=1 Tax=Dactylellina haptotyla (strain CBS 200.50) TaxID=1284197 RepID=S8A6Q3_DACHA|nr:hypothetical protein H072_7539 [Dactylellina haptotyla CBS 200.50]